MFSFLCVCVEVFADSPFIFLGEFENFNLIEAKVPILRFRDRHNLFEVDLNFNNCVGIKNTHLLYCYSQCKFPVPLFLCIFSILSFLSVDWRLRPLVLITKLWAQFHDINNAKNMTISSYSLVLMVVHFLQYAVQPPILPCLHEMYPEKFQLIVRFTNKTISELLTLIKNFLI